MSFSVISDNSKIEEVNWTSLLIAPGKVCGIAVVFFFVSFAIYCCCFYCKCNRKRSYDPYNENARTRTQNSAVNQRMGTAPLHLMATPIDPATQLPVVNQTVGVASLPLFATPINPALELPVEDNFTNHDVNISNQYQLEIEAKSPPSYEEVLKYDYRMFATGVTVAPPTYSESIVMITESEIL